jgi:hypothetical protein
LPIAICEKSAGALMRSRPRGCSRRDGGGAVRKLREKRTGPLVKRASFLREFHSAGPAFKQPEPQAVLEFADPARERGLRTLRHTGGLAEAPVTGNEVEIRESKKVHVFHQ